MSHLQKFDPKKSNRRSVGPSRGAKIGAVVAGVAVVGLIASAGIAAVSFSGNRPAQIDATSGCLIAAPTPATTVALLDLSDEFDLVQKQQANAAVMSAAAKLPDYGRLVIAGMNAAAPQSPLIEASLCAPERAKGSSWTTGTISNTRDFSKRVEEPSQAAVNALISKAHNTASPIIETISAISRMPDFDQSRDQRTLIIASDLLQNDRLPVQVRGLKGDKKPDPRFYTQYSYLDLEQSFNGSRLAQRLKPDLRGVRVVIVYLERQDAAPFQTNKHRRFWKNYLLSLGATSVEFAGTADT